jgi:hypothetical protein
MTEPIETRFETPNPIRLRVEVLVGDVSVSAGEVTTTTVRLLPRGTSGAELAEKFTVEQRGGEVVVLAPKLRDGFFSFTKGSVDVEVELPAGSTVDARSGAGDVRTTGRLGDVRAATGAGDVSVDDADEADLKSGSGDLSVETARGDVRSKTGSGDVSVGSTGGRADLTSGSGDISLRECRGAVKARTGSGDLSIGSSTGDLELVTGTGDITLAAVQGGEVNARTGTGDVAIGVAAGVAALLDLNSVTGDVEVDLDSADGPGDAEARTRLTVHSGSGDIRVARARLTPV